MAVVGDVLEKGIHSKTKNPFMETRDRRTNSENPEKPANLL